MLKKKVRHQLIAPEFFNRIDPEETVERYECGGKLKIIAAIEEPALIVRILSHLGLPSRAPPRAPARRVGLFQAA
jgi:hypothetical protein